MTHALKTWPRFYKRVVDGSKPFELRKCDIIFEVGDTLFLQEYDPTTSLYTGKESEFIITYILHGGEFGIMEGYCAMGIKPKEHI